MTWLYCINKAYHVVCEEGLQEGGDVENVGGEDLLLLLLAQNPAAPEIPKKMKQKSPPPRSLQKQSNPSPQRFIENPNIFRTDSEDNSVIICCIFAVKCFVFTQTN